MGDERELAGNLPCRQLAVGGVELLLPDGIDYLVRLSNTGSGVLLSGTARAQAVGECARCLGPATLELKGELEGYFVTRPRDAELGDDDDGVTYVGPDGLIDLELPITAALVEAVPFVLLCRPDCAGLCPHCGADLNTEPCTCNDSPDPDHPLAALRGLWDSGALG